MIQPIPRILPFLSITVELHLLSKVLEWSILLAWEHYFTTSDLQFGFNSGYSTTLRTGVMKAVISHYLNSGSRVSACFVDAPTHLIWLTIVSCLTRYYQEGCQNHLLSQWYKSQQLCARWMSRSSSYFQVYNGVQQGVLSPILFTDSLLESQGQWKRLLWNTHFASTFCYADDLTILAPSPDALSKMIAECESFAKSHGLWFNATKTQLICFQRSLSPTQAQFWFCEQRSYHRQQKGGPRELQPQLNLLEGRVSSPPPKSINPRLPCYKVHSVLELRTCVLFTSWDLNIIFLSFISLQLEVAMVHIPALSCSLSTACWLGCWSQ